MALALYFLALALKSEEQDLGLVLLALASKSEDQVLSLGLGAAGLVQVTEYATCASLSAETIYRCDNDQLSDNHL